MTLRALRAADFESVHPHAANPAVTRFMTWGPNTESDESLDVLLSHASSTLDAHRVQACVDAEKLASTRGPLA